MLIEIILVLLTISFLVFAGTLLFMRVTETVINVPLTVVILDSDDYEDLEDDEPSNPVDGKAKWEQLLKEVDMGGGEPTVKPRVRRDDGPEGPVH